MFEGLTFIDLLAKGGVTVVVLALFSLVSIAIMIERAWTFKGFAVKLPVSFDLLSAALKSKGLSAAVELSREKATPLGNVFLSGYSKRSKGRDEVLRAMELSGRGEIAGLQNRLGIIGTIGATAPFIGLFGTVLGIIRAFGDLAVTQSVGPAVVSDGIAEALVTTAAGLLVAIPAVIAYNYFVRSVQRHALALETLASEFTDNLTEGG
jgi:biopolymer transport protein ExbB/TolQ